MRCKYWPHECIGSYWACPYSDKYGCNIKPIYKEIKEHIEELEKLRKAA